MVWCLIGLGNPGEKYADTRHNVGFEVIDRLSARWGISVNQSNPLFLFGSGDFREIPVVLVKPMTFMNRSGQAYKRLLADPEMSTERTLIIYDDLHLPFGKIRIRRQGGDGGHNGLHSVLQAAGTDEIPRLRIGIEGSDENWLDYVLTPFSSKEYEIINESYGKAADAVESILMDGYEKSMNLFNR